MILVRCLKWSDEKIAEELFLPMNKLIGSGVLRTNHWKRIVFDLLKEGHLVEFVDNLFIFRVEIGKYGIWTCNTPVELAYMEEGPIDYFMDHIIKLLWDKEKYSRITMG